MTRFDVILPQRQKSVVHLSSAALPGPNWAAGMTSLSKLLKRNPQGTGVNADPVPVDLTVVEPKTRSGFVHLISKDKDVSKSTDNIPAQTESDEEEVHSDIDVTGLTDEVYRRPTGSTPPPVDLMTPEVPCVPSLKDVCPTTKEVYGFEIEPLSTKDLGLYARYAGISAAMERVRDGERTAYGTFYPEYGITRVHEDPYFDRFEPKTDYSQFFNVVPVVPQKSMQIYERTVALAQGKATAISLKDLALYRAYAEASEL